MRCRVADGVDGLLQVPVALALALVPQVEVPRPQRRPGTRRSGPRSRPGRSCRPAGGGRRVRYCGTLPVPSGMRGSRSSCAAAGRRRASASVATIARPASAKTRVNVRGPAMARSLGIVQSRKRQGSPRGRGGAGPRAEVHPALPDRRRRLDAAAELHRPQRRRRLRGVGDVVRVQVAEAVADDAARRRRRPATARPGRWAGGTSTAPRRWPGRCRCTSPPVVSKMAMSLYSAGVPQTPAGTLRPVVELPHQRVVRLGRVELHHLPDLLGRGRCPSRTRSRRRACPARRRRSRRRCRRRSRTGTPAWAPGPP